MKLPTRNSIGAVLLIALVSLQCANLRVLRRHARAEFQAELPAYVKRPDSTGQSEVRPSMQVTAFAFPAEIKTKTPFIKELSERGQQALIERLGEAGIGSVKKPDSDIQRLQKGLVFTSAATPATVIDKTSFKKRIVVSYEDLNRVPGERFDFTKVIIKIPTDSKATFESWDKIETKYGSIDLGKVSATGASAFSVDATLGSEIETGQSTTGISLLPSFSWSRSLTEDQVYHEQFINITGMMTPKSITLIRTGAMGQNLDGNVVIEVTMRMDESGGENVVFKLENLYNASDVASKPDCVKVSERRFRLPGRTQHVEAQLSYAYRLRKFQNRTARYAKTIPEFDDRVAFVSSEKYKGDKLTLLTSKELATYFFSLVHEEGTIHYKGPDGEAKPFLFETYEEAQEVINWMRDLTNSSDEPIVIGSEYRLLKGPNTSKPLKWSDKDHLRADLYY